MSFRVLSAGLLTTVQDEGRPGFQRYGVVAGGAMDAFAFRAANILAGNDPGAAALEFAMAGPTLRFAAPCVVAIAGAAFRPTIDGATVPTWTPVAVAAGATLRIGAAAEGVYGYLAVSGGIRVPPVMNSRSTYLRAGLGGCEGRALRDGDEAAWGEPNALQRKMLAVLGATRGGAGFAASGWRLTSRIRPRCDANPTVRAIEGVQHGLFESSAAAAFASTGYRVLPQSDRMGMRLQGGPLRLREPKELLSEAVTFGTVQVPPDGQPIVLMADRQTTGGYPKLAQVIGVDLPLLAQARAGSIVRFRFVSIREAQRLLLLQAVQLDLLAKGVYIRFS